MCPKKRSERGEILIGFILVAMIVLLLVWGIIDICRYTMLKSSVQGAVADASNFAKSQDALLADAFNPADPGMPKYLLARQSLSRVFESNPVAQSNINQITRLQVVEYGSQSGPTVDASKPEYVAYLPPGTSARVAFADGTTRWVHHTVCCDPTVGDCPESSRRTNPANPCFNKSYNELIGLYPTEFVTASSFKNTQIFNSNVVTRSSGFPRVQIAAAPVIVIPTTTTIPTIIITSTTIPEVTTTTLPRCTPPTTPEPRCTYDRTSDKLSLLSYTMDPQTCVFTSHIEREITRPLEHCDPTRGIIGYRLNEEECRFEEVVKTSVPTITEARRCIEADRTLTLRTQVINPATCQLQTNEEVRTRGGANCVERDGALWHESSERNLLTCDWDRGALRKVQDKPALFCGNDPATGEFVVRSYVPDYSICNYAVDTTPIPRREVECSVNSVTGEGQETHFTFSSAACQFVASPSISQPRPANECVETEIGVQATYTQHNDFSRVADSCQWNTTRTTVSAPSKSCVERLNTTSGKNEAVKTSYVINTTAGGCTYAPQETVTTKPDNVACVVEGRRANKKSYILNSDPDLCGYTEQIEPCTPIDCEVSDWVLPPNISCGSTYLVTRTVTRPPQYGGRECPTLSEERRAEPCPIDCEVSDWSVPTNPACGQDYTATRTVIREPQHGGQACPALTEIRHGPECQEQCVWVTQWMNWSGIWSGGSGPRGQNLVDASRTYNFETPTAVPGCFNSRFAPSCENDLVSGNVSIFGGCTWDTSAGGGGGTGWTGALVGGAAQAVADFIGVPASAFAPTSTGAAGYVTYVWYMDDQCRYVPNLNSNMNVCGFAGTSWSPISLVLDDTASLDEEMTVVPFSVDPRQPEAFSIWKASDKAPLLVYDPANTGKVSSARQLFGSYAFGGKTNQPSNYQVAQVREPWSDGYEALALLDSNNDNEISNAELESLKLWFDQNRNGVVESGEMRTLKEEGITKLFYKAPKNVPSSQDKEIEIGYQRSIDGKTIYGRSVDWFSKSFTSRQEAQEALRLEMSRQEVSTHAMNEKNVPTIEKYILPVELAGNPGKFTPHVATDHERDISGFWLWNSTDKEGNTHPGLFALEQNGDKIYGWDIVESVLEKNAGNRRSAITLYPVEGLVKHNEDGTRTLTFTVHDTKGEGKAINTAMLTTNGSVLQGSTAQSFAVDRDGKNYSATVKYDWVGRKFIAPAK